MRISDEEERNFYLDEVANENWTVRVLERNIKSGYYKRMLSTQLSDTENKTLEFARKQQIFASKYMTVLPTVEELQRELERNQLIYNQD